MGGGVQGGHAVVIDSDGEVPRGEKMLYSGTDPESYITEYTLVYEDKIRWLHQQARISSGVVFIMNTI